MKMEKFTGTMFGNIKNKRNKVVTIISILVFTFIGVTILDVLYDNNEEINKHDKVIDDTKYDEESINEEMIVITYSIARREPSNDSDKIDTYNKGDKVKVVSKLTNNWYKVKTYSNYAYIKCENIKSTKEVFIDNLGVVISSVEPDNTISIDGNVSNSILNYAYNYWYLIPENVRADFKEQGWSILLTDKSLSKDLEIKYPVAGVTLTKDKIIKICGNQSSIRRALVHEIGHYIDYRNNFISRQITFKEMYDNNGSKLLDYDSNYVQAGYSEEEYFAELYRAYILNQYRIKFMFSNDIEYVVNMSNKLGTMTDNKAA